MITQNELECIKSETSATEVFEAGQYICGHPDIDEAVDIYLAVAANAFAIMARRHPESTAKRLIGEIPMEAVRQITVEDKSTIEKRVTAARVLALGIFAFAFKKKEINEAGFVVIDWTDGRGITHNTTFKIEGEGALAAANTLRNSLLRRLPG